MEERPAGSSETAGGPPAKPSAASPWALAGAGMELAGVVVAFTLGGWWLDKKLGTGPWLMLVGAFVSIVGGLYNLYRTGRRSFGPPRLRPRK